MQGSAVFASDFHLSSRDPESVLTFRSFVEECVLGAGAFFILGDLFDTWIGPAQLKDPGLKPALTALRSLAQEGTRLTILQGNRDFLLGWREEAELEARIPGESMEVEIQGIRLFLAHGDMFCSRDRAYQRMKRVLRSPIVRVLAGILPPPAVMALARRLRSRSERAVSAKTAGETDLHVPDIESLVSARNYDAVICGHIHRTEERILTGGARLIVLSEWSKGRGGYALARDGTIALREFTGCGGTGR
jgi:UDP-2,3-diacylglucosamine hydrolase